MESIISIVHLGDCLEAMKQYPDKYFDLAVVDPPYGINIANNSFRQKQTKLDFTGYEIDLDYWTAQEKRFKEYKSQLKMF